MGLLLAGLATPTTWLRDAVGEPERGPTIVVEALAATPVLKPGQIVLEKSRVYALVGKTGLGHEHGIVGKIKAGKLNLNAAEDVGEIEFDMTSFLADTNEARKFVELKGATGESTRDKVTQTMLGESVLDVEEFPTATFTIKSRELRRESKKSGPGVVLKGHFTLHGQTRPLEVVVQVDDKEGMKHLRGDFTILQSDFDITPYKAALGTVGVADKLKIWGDIWIAGDKAPPKQ